ncbi:hypothetical protein KUCAC02_019681, partial [Chaenocephalus aceratus]
MDGLCLVAAPCNASWVIMVITQPSEARPEAPGMTRSDRRAWDEERWRLKGGGGVKMLMSDDDKCFSSSVICAALTDRRLVAGRRKSVLEEVQERRAASGSQHSESGLRVQRGIGRITVLNPKDSSDSK